MTKVCVRCKTEKSITKFKLVKGKYRAGYCHTCSNSSKESMDSKRRRLSNSRLLEIQRMRLFLSLWHQNLPYEVCIQKLNEIYGESVLLCLEVTD